MRQEESVGRNARCVSIIEKEEKKKGAERKEGRKEPERRRERDDDWTIAGCRSRAQRQTGGRRRCARLYTASTGDTAVLTCHHIDIVIICKCARARIRTSGILMGYVLFWVMEVRTGKGDHRISRRRDKKIYANRLSLSSVMKAVIRVF